MSTGAAAIDWFDAGDVQQITIHQMFGKWLTGFEQGNDDFALHDQHHFRLPHLVCRPIGKVYSEGLKRLMKQMFLDYFWSHDFSQ